MKDFFDFNDLTIIEIPVKIKGNDYVLREADEETAAIYNNARLKGIPVKDAEVVGLPEDIGGIPSLLVSRCLFPLDSKGNSLPDHVKRETVQKLSSRIVKPLYAELKKISELDDKEDLKSLMKQREELNKRIKTLEDEEGKTKNS